MNTAEELDKKRMLRASAAMQRQTNFQQGGGGKSKNKATKPQQPSESSSSEFDILTLLDFVNEQTISKTDAFAQIDALNVSKEAKDHYKSCLNPQKSAFTEI